MAASDGTSATDTSVSIDKPVDSPPTDPTGAGAVSTAAPFRRAAGRGSARPPIYRGLPYTKVVALLLVVFWWRETQTVGLKDEALINDWLFYSSLVIGFYFVFGLSGQFAFSQAAVAGLGAYTSAWVTRNELTFFWGFVVAVLVCTTVGILFSLLVRRSAHFYFAIGTLALSEILLKVFTTWKDFTAPNGEISGVEDVQLFGWIADSRYRVFCVLLGFAGALLVLGHWIERSPVRREVIAARDQETVSATLGLSTLRLRVTMFALGSAIAGAMGSLWIHTRGSTDAEQWGVGLGLGVFLMLILGGMGSMYGAFLGAWFYVYVQDWIRGDYAKWWQVIYGGTLIVIMVFVPAGLLGTVQRLRSLRRGGGGGSPGWLGDLLGTMRRRATGGEPEVAHTPATRPVPADIAVAGATRTPREVGEPIVEATEVSVSFGGVRAVDGVSLALNEGEILGLIGPNGSGKSTFLNAATGVVHATGSLRIDGTRVSWGRPGAVRRRGVLRTYQTPQTFLDLTCIENVLLSTDDRRLNGIFASWVLRPLMLAREHQRWALALSALERFGLADRAEESAANLSYGQQRMLEMARVVAGRPRIVLLDEPSAGLNAAETETLARHLVAMREEGMSLLLVDHKIDFITQLCDRVAVLELGHKVAEGDPVAIWEDQRVVDAYLGVAD
jgi:branched-chain amino acid transport system permease protein